MVPDLVYKSEMVCLMSIQVIESKPNAGSMHGGMDGYTYISKLDANDI